MLLDIIVNHTRRFSRYAGLQSSSISCEGLWPRYFAHRPKKSLFCSIFLLFSFQFCVSGRRSQNQLINVDTSSVAIRKPSLRTVYIFAIPLKSAFTRTLPLKYVFPFHFRYNLEDHFKTHLSDVDV